VGRERGREGQGGRSGGGRCSAAFDCRTLRKLITLVLPMDARVLCDALLAASSGLRGAAQLEEAAALKKLKIMHCFGDTVNWVPFVSHRPIAFALQCVLVFSFRLLECFAHYGTWEVWGTTSSSQQLSEATTAINTLT